ncbi:hypothetical protein TTHERM_000842568 (macronuclear) [Tetrahymena thermophila SB210]|uniref:Uncharacterized protein n=1 Tax=Tetrahymena thermophila (strain SB210) TaxID=312017 RepID=W7XE39_TETTS|nr:hypothetical protein TTHERM_000842568 [Tetrahymena thermophila SB210]EWS71129.1 hypothetical protein TTHERM_000842568 [Tetrahymena thermophila SB210]|eukprot:XP_012656337.1 hypothetical protein TTHERM_000842568 [Tetrahymena thermophila SB210]
MIKKKTILILLSILYKRKGVEDQVLIRVKTINDQSLIKCFYQLKFIIKIQNIYLNICIKYSYYIQKQNQCFFIWYLFSFNYIKRIFFHKFGFNQLINQLFFRQKILKKKQLKIINLGINLFLQQKMVKKHHIIMLHQVFLSGTLFVESFQQSFAHHHLYNKRHSEINYFVLFDFHGRDSKNEQMKKQKLFQVKIFNMPFRFTGFQPIVSQKLYSIYLGSGVYNTCQVYYFFFLRSKQTNNQSQMKKDLYWLKKLSKFKNQKTFKYFVIKMKTNIISDKHAQS